MKDMEKKNQFKLSCEPLHSVLNDLGYSHQEKAGLNVFFSLLNIHESQEVFLSKQDAAQWLLNVTQKRFLRRGERWSTENKSTEEKLSHQRAKVLEGAQLLRLMEKEVPDSETLFKSHISILPGALEKRVIQRIESIVDEIRQSGQLPSMVVAVTGYRQLNTQECVNVTLAARTEEHMMRYQWGLAIKRHAHLAHVPFYVSCAQLKPKQMRSTTEDTVAVFKTDPILSQYNTAILHVEKPYAKRFAHVFHELPIDVYLFAQASSIDEVPLFVYQDEVARSIYFLFPRLQKKYASQPEQPINQDNYPKV